MNHSPTATLIVPAYNVSATIAETIDSLLKQTFTDFELIVVDDGSSDSTGFIVKGFHDPRIRLVRQANRGLAGARNTGIANARGRYIGFCDADDLWLPEKLERHVAHLEARAEVGISFSGSQMIDTEGRPIGINQSPKLTNITPALIFKRNPIGNGSAALIRREALDALAYRPLNETERDWWFDETFRQSDDIEAWARFALTLDWRIEGIPGALTLYRIHTGGLSANIEKQYATWQRMYAKMRTIAPALIDSVGKDADAYQLRYLARRAVTMRDGDVASRLAWKSLATSLRPLLEEPLKTVTTVAAATLLKLLGQKAYARAETIALNLKNAH